MRRFIDEVINGGNLAAIDELWAEDLSWHGGSLGNIHGLTAYKEFAAANASGAFTGMHLDVKEVFTAGDKVIVRFTNSGTQTGPFMGTAPSGAHGEWLASASTPSGTARSPRGGSARTSSACSSSSASSSSPPNRRGRRSVICCPPQVPRAKA